MEYDKGIEEGAAGIALPTLVSTLAISCVFISVVFLEGAPRYLFTPQGYAVVFAMLASYTLSRTLVPIINRILLRAEYLGHGHDNPGFFGRFQRGFNDRFERFRNFYVWVLHGFIARRYIIPLIGGLLFAAVFVYLLMVVNFQDFIDPPAVILGLPGAGCGIVMMLFITGTTLSVPSLMGAIMAIGVASANSILLVTFARERLLQGVPPEQAACEAGRTRLRPVLLTAGAMVVGMLPMAIGAPSEEQNTVLARAVIGGLLVGTLTTLFVVP